MAPKRGRTNKEKGTSTFAEYDREKFTSAETKLRFDKVVEINESFILERGMDFIWSQMANLWEFLM